MTILAVDFGSTFTKGALLADDGAVLGTSTSTALVNVEPTSTHRTAGTAVR